MSRHHDSWYTGNPAKGRFDDRPTLQAVRPHPRRLCGTAGSSRARGREHPRLAAGAAGYRFADRRRPPVVGGKIAYVSSSAAGDGTTPGAATLTAAQAWVLAAQNVGKPVSLVSVLSAKTDSRTGWTGLHVAGFDGFQRARLTAFPTYTQGVRPAYETIVLDAQGGTLTGYREFVDAQSGAVRFRY